MTRAELIEQIKLKKSFLCVGLDPDMNKIPPHLLKEEDPIFAFNKQIIDATNSFAVAYKPNSAFYEACGIKGMRSLQKTITYLKQFPVFTIADAKRGDIGNTSAQYAKAFLSPEGDFDFDAITVAPYMGEDSISPFFAYPNKWVVLLALTSNKGANDFQLLKNTNDQKTLFESVLTQASKWGNIDNLMFVVGATQAQMLTDIRKYVPNHFLLVPGVGAQGGSLTEVCKYGMTSEVGLLINASRSILYASKDLDFASKAAEEAKRMQGEMSQLLPF
ncbi:MAG: orotidine-5'-phosphate decarboxylase [Bacteroidales bacterium]